MKIKLPLLGEISIGRPKEPEVVEVIKEVETKKKAVLGSFLDFGIKPLSDETRASTKILNANKGWVYKNNDVIAKAVAEIEFELYSVKIVGQDIVYTEIKQHPILDILDRFNDFTSASDGFYTTQSHRKLVGDAFWYIEGKAPNITNIYILPPDKVEIMLGKEQGSMRVIQGYKYRDTIKDKTVEITYTPEEIIHFKVPSPKNFYRGYGAVEAAADTIDMDNMAIESNKKLFERGLIANFLLSTEKSLTPEQLKQLHSEFRNTYGGVENAFKVPILGGGLSVQNTQMTNRDAQFLEMQQWVRDKIMAIFGNTKSVLGITEDVNRANAEATILNWKRQTVRPEMKGICDTLNEFLVPMFGNNLLLGFEDPVEEDESQGISDIVSLINANVITPNEAREELDYDPLTDPSADTLRVQATPQIPTVPPVPKALKHVKREAVLRRIKAYDQIEEYKKLKEQARPLAKELVKKKKAKANKTKDVGKPIMSNQWFSEDKVWEYYNKQMNLIETHTHILQQHVEKFINKLVDKALHNMPGEVQEMQNKQLFNEEDLIVEATLDFTPILNDIAVASGVDALRLINSDAVYLPTNIQKLIADRVKLFATSMIETDKNKLIDIISSGVQNGQSIGDIANTISDEFNTYSKMQAERIARTEVSQVSTNSALDAWEQSGVVEGKQWITAGATDECAAFEGQIVYDLKGNFYDTSEFADGDPPLHPNCKCSLIPVLSGEKGHKVDLTSKKATEELKKAQERINELEEFVSEELGLE